MVSKRISRWSTQNVCLRWFGVMLVGILWILGGGAVFGHAHLSEAMPPPDAVLREAPEEIRLTFSEPIELPFSTVKVYALPPGDDPKGAAASIVSEMIGNRGDDGARADDGSDLGSGVSDTVTIGLKEPLSPGHYVVMWRVLSVDTHTTTDFYVFLYEP